MIHLWIHALGLKVFYNLLINLLFYGMAIGDSWWIKDLCLKKEDKCMLFNGFSLNDRLVNASQVMIKERFRVDGLQSTFLGQKLKFIPVSKSDTYVIQILHTGTSDAQ